jgi:hypothetical protein
MNYDIDILVLARTPTDITLLKAHWKNASYLFNNFSRDRPEYFT